MICFPSLKNDIKKLSVFDVWAIAFQNSFGDFVTFILLFAINKNYFIFYVIVSRKTNICTL